MNVNNLFLSFAFLQGSLEEKVYQRQISKQSLSGAVMDLKTSNIQFSQEELKVINTLLSCSCQIKMNAHRKTVFASPISFFKKM
jgi:hypothetical protein